MTPIAPAAVAAAQREIATSQYALDQHVLNQIQQRIVQGITFIEHHFTTGGTPVRRAEVLNALREARDALGLLAQRPSRAE